MSNQVNIPAEVIKIVAIHVATLQRYATEIERAKALDVRFASGERYVNDVKINFTELPAAVARLQEIGALAVENKTDPISLFLNAGLTVEQVRGFELADAREVFDVQCVYCEKPVVIRISLGEATEAHQHEAVAVLKQDCTCDLCVFALTDMIDAAEIEYPVNRA